MSDLAKQFKMVTKEDELPPFEILAEHIAEISKLGRAIKKSKLSEKAIILLIYDWLPANAHINRGHIKAVLDALPELEKTYLKKQ